MQLIQRAPRPSGHFPAVRDFGVKLRIRIAVVITPRALGESASEISRALRFDVQPSELLERRTIPDLLDRAVAQRADGIARRLEQVVAERHPAVELDEHVGPRILA